MTRDPTSRPGAHNAGDDETGEERLIARHFRPLARHPGAFGLVDDCAAIAPPAGHDLVLKADAIVSSVHFFPEDPADAVARKALRVNLSDLAAKGATPLGFLLSLALPKPIDEAWLAGFAAGLDADAQAYQIPLLGGDTVLSPGPIMVSVAVFGSVPHGRMLLRSGPQVGDVLVVTGTIGDAALGLLVRRERAAAARWGLTEAARDHLLARYLLPQPRNAVTQALRAHASGGMDVSDGLIGDLGKMCRAAKVSAEVEVTQIPFSDAARAAIAADPTLIEPALTGGDDFEVLASVPAGKLDALKTQCEALGIPVTAIGRFVAAGEGGPQARILAAGAPLVFARTSFSHF
jgi:thiamine-monophosphate kinase